MLIPDLSQTLKPLNYTTFQELRIWKKGTWVQSLIQSCDIVTCTRLLNLSEPQFCHLYNGDNNTSLICFYVCTVKNEARRRMWTHVALSILFLFFQEFGIRSFVSEPLKHYNKRGSMSRREGTVSFPVSPHPSSMECLILQGCPSSL